MIGYSLWGSAVCQVHDPVFQKSLRKTSSSRLGNSGLHQLGQFWSKWTNNKIDKGTCFTVRNRPGMILSCFVGFFLVGFVYWQKWKKTSLSTSYFCFPYMLLLYQVHHRVITGTCRFLPNNTKEGLLTVTLFEMFLNNLPFIVLLVSVSCKCIENSSR